MNKLKIHVLVDNLASDLCQAEHGLSYIIEYDEKVLFDTGQSPLFLTNAKKVGAPIDETNYVTLSHGHCDHGNGLAYLKNKTLVCHPGVFKKRFSGKQRKFVGLNLTKNELSEHYRIITTQSPYFFSENMVFITQIPRVNHFESRSTRFYLENNQPDDLTDDSALVVTMKKGLFIISGCAHSGICNIIEYAKKVTGDQRVYGLMGGFHLKFNDATTHKTIEYLKKQNPRIVMPSHCTALPALAAIYREFKGEQVHAGTLYTFNE